MDTIRFSGFAGLGIVADAFGREGDPAVVLLPSAGGTREMWHESAMALADAGRYAVCIDLRGHGQSEWASDGNYSIDAYVADLKAVLAKMSARAVLVGAGLGGLIALAVAGESATPLLSALTLIDVNLWPDDVVSERLTKALRRQAEPIASTDALRLSVGKGHSSEPTPLTSRHLSAYRKTAAGGFEWRGDPRALVFATDEPYEQRLRTAAGNVSVPSVLLRGTLNDTITSEAARRLQGLIKDCEFAEIEGAGHFKNAESSDDFNAILLDFIERVAPRTPLKYVGGSQARILRDALGCFGTGVTVVTTINGDDVPFGFTANSFTAVSLAPPLIMFSMAKTSANLQTFADAGKFAVNVLHIGQQPAAGRFAQQGQSRFADIEWCLRDDEGSPILEGSLASFDCRTYAVHQGGDHLIFIGEVKNAWYEPHRDPLLYFRGKYRRLHFA